MSKPIVNFLAPLDPENSKSWMHENATITVSKDDAIRVTVLNNSANPYVVLDISKAELLQALKFHGDVQ
jgi:hypothetical protein